MSKQLLYTKHILITFLLLLSLSVGSSQLSAQELEVKAPRTVVVGKQFAVQYILNNIEPSARPKDPTFKGLELLYGPARSNRSETYNINGRITSKHSYVYTYTFIADRAGNFSIRGFALPTDKGVLKGRKVVVKVLAPSREQEAGMSLRPFLSSQTSKKTVYEQEALTISHKLYVENYRFRYDHLEPIKYEDIIAQDIDLNRNDILDKEKVQGSIYNTITLAKQIIIPKTVGTLQLPVIESAIYVPIPSEDVFMSTEERRIKLQSRSLSLKVLPLPSEGRPLDFSGAVGNFSIKASFKPTEEVETNKAYNLKLHIEGLGSLKSARLPKVNFPTSFECYPATSEQDMFYDKATATIRSVADVEYSFIPRSKGNFTIPALSFSFFNPKTKRYEVLKTKTIEIKVKQGKDANAGTIVQEANYSGSLLSKYRKGKGAGELEGLSLLSFWYFLGYLLLMLTTAIVIIFLLRHRALRRDIVGFKARRANSVAVKRLKLAKTYANENKSELFYEETLRALWGYVGDKFRLPASMLSRERIQELFAEEGFEADITKNYCRLLDELEFARYAPQKGEQQLQDLYDQTVNLITTIENNK